MTLKRGRGRPAHKPTPRTREQVILLTAFGNTEHEAALILGIGHTTLRQHYRHELETGRSTANYRVAHNLYRQATKDDPKAFPAIKFWLNCRAGWSEYKPAELAEKLGKKEVAQIVAETAEQGTGWSGLVN